MAESTDRRVAAASDKKDFLVSAPAVSLPKGGGAIRGMGEKFAANPVTGTGSMSVPIATSPGRGGFGPQLSLAYDSGAGNGPFGFGWSLSLPSINRKTDKGLPRYDDAAESDVYILSGAEDLVPAYRLDADGNVLRDREGNPRLHEDERGGYRIRRYRPRIEGLFARIERWTHLTTGEMHWRSITRDNITTLYGKDNLSRIFDPADPDPVHPTRIFSWLICQSYDDKGNAIVYDYVAENSSGIALGQAHERNRTVAGRAANRYLKRIKYGNRVSRLVEPDLTRAEWMFEVVFDYGEGHYAELPLDPTQPAAEQHRYAHVNDSPSPGVTWPVRPDPFSTYRAGFEVRTYRRCQRVLMFHRFAELGATPCLVRSTAFAYADFDYTRPGPIDAVVEHAHPGSTRLGSTMVATTQSGYVRQSDGRYLKKSLPPLEFEYSQARIQDDVRQIDAADLENLPIGLDGKLYQWVDLDGEGVSGILTEQAGAWFYKRNLGNGHLARQEQVALIPSLAALNGGRQQLLDLAGDGQLELVDFGGPTPGFFERSHDERWDPFTSFASLPLLAWDDPNLRFVDLNGDGHADVLITEQEVFQWHPSLAEDGFGPGRRVHQPVDEEQGPRLVFADGEQSIYLADMSGDGLTDLVRIRNGEVCYWPNLGYGRFGARVTMDGSPWFDTPDLFDQRRIRLADVDGSGVVDILYLGRGEVSIFFNQSGNRWSRPRRLRDFPRIDSLSSVQAVDLLGNGTACLVWSSPLPGDTASPLRYIDLMGGNKPRLLVCTRNNLGAQTRVEYAPSTQFYLADKLAGRPWITKLAFPVHCVEKVTVTDQWRKTSFSTTYSYHHGYFDGHEREFRGFGRVEQVDVESYGEFRQGNANSPYITDDKTLYQPPVKTVTWYHTGAYLDRRRILSHFAGEYFPAWFTARRPGEPDPLHGFAEKALPEPDLATEGLTAEEWREALRACKGMVLRQEIYELDVDALEDGEQRRVKLFSAAQHNCHIERLQEQASNRHAVFMVTESEAITYHYELDLRSASLSPDPRIAHTLNLRTDRYGNVLQAVAAVYPRRGRFADDPLLDDADLRRIRAVQSEPHLAYTEVRTTDDVDTGEDYRLRVPWETLTYELTGIAPRERPYFTLDELRGYQLSTVHQATGTAVDEILYHELPGGSRQKRCVEHTRTLFFRDDPTDPRPLLDPLPVGQLGRLGLTFESYKLALTDTLLDAIFADDTGNKLDRPARDATTARQLLADAAVSGYLSGSDLVTRFAPTPAAALAGQYWIRSGIAGFAPDAARHFYLPERYTDPFDNVTTLVYDARDLYVASSTDALGNTTEVMQFDYRVLAPREMADVNSNLSQVYFDALGLPTAMAIKGKGVEGDNLDGFDVDLANPTEAELATFFAATVYDEGPARRWLGNVTARHVYHFGEIRDADGLILPACACGIAREQHVARLEPGVDSPLQTACEYSDGMGSVLVKKVQAEPAAADGPLRWIASGKTVLNNKGKPVKQYEPYFSGGGHRFEDPIEEGVTPVIYYDAAGRIVRTEAPDGSTSRVEFSPWHVATYDANDTVLEAGNAWYARMTAASASAEERRAAQIAAKHAATPALTVLDSLGRDVVAIAYNHTPDQAPAFTNMPLLDRPWHDEKVVTFTKLDAEGKPLWIRDGRGNLVMQYITPTKPTRAIDEPDQGNIETMPLTSVPCYDIAGNLLYQHSMDAGDRWTLIDAAGKPMFSWDFNERQTDGGAVDEQRLYFTEYDALHRPTAQWLRINDDARQRVERYEYRDTRNADGTANPRLVEDRNANLLGQLVRHYDPSGLVETIRRDFRGNVLETRRTLIRAYDAPVVDWSSGPDTTMLEDETYAQITEYDALNRMARQYNWHRVMPDSRVAVYEPRYNARGLLVAEDLIIRAAKTDSGYELRPGTRTEHAILDIRYDAKGQTEHIERGNGTITRYIYDPQTFRLRQLRTTRPGYDPPFPDHHSRLADDRVLQQLHYTYDASGNISEICDEAYEPVFFCNQDVRARSRYTYDALYRLIEATGRENGLAVGSPPQIQNAPDHIGFPNCDRNALRNYIERYRYDVVGNIEQMEHIAPLNGGWTRRYAYAADSNRLLRTWEGADRWENDEATNKVTHHYNTHGSMLNLAEVPAAYRLRWDHRDMIQTVDLGGGGRAYYQYDAGKERTRKVIVGDTGNGQWERCCLGGMELYRHTVSGAQVEEIETYHLFVGEQRVLIVEDVLETRNSDLGVGARFRYQYSNHLGSACVEMDESAVVTSYEEYHPYGTSAYLAGRAAGEVSLKRYRYTGKERDGETGLSYHSARYYALWLGRWASADPTGMADGINVYQFVRNNPIRLADTTGTQSHETDAERNARIDRIERWGGFMLGIVVGAEDALTFGLFGRFYGQHVNPSGMRELQQTRTFDPARRAAELTISVATLRAGGGGIAGGFRTMARGLESRPLATAGGRTFANLIPSVANPVAVRAGRRLAIAGAAAAGSAATAILMMESGGAGGGSPPSGSGGRPPSTPPPSLPPPATPPPSRIPLVANIEQLGGVADNIYQSTPLLQRLAVAQALTGYARQRETINILTEFERTTRTSVQFVGRGVVSSARGDPWNLSSLRTAPGRLQIEQIVLRYPRRLLREVTHELSNYYAWQYSGGVGRPQPKLGQAGFSLGDMIEAIVQGSRRPRP